MDQGFIKDLLNLDFLSKFSNYLVQGASGTLAKANPVVPPLGPVIATDEKIFFIIHKNSSLFCIWKSPDVVGTVAPTSRRLNTMRKISFSIWNQQFV